MDNWYEYLKARDDIKDFYQVVWNKSLRKTIKELSEKIKEYDPKVYEKLNNQLYEDKPIDEEEDHSELGQLMKSLFDHIKPLEERKEDEQYINAQGELIEPTESELYKEEKAILLRMMPEFTKIFNIIYGAFIPKSIIQTTKIKGLHDLHWKFRDVNAMIRYPTNCKRNPYYDHQKARDARAQNRKYDWIRSSPEKSHEFLEFNTGVIEHMKSNRDFITHQDDAGAIGCFEAADRPISDPLTKISHPENYIMLANHCMACVYEIIELMQIWVDSNKIGKENSS